MEIQWHRAPQLTVRSCTTALCDKAPNRELGNDCLTAPHLRVAREEPETLGSVLVPGTWHLAPGAVQTSYSITRSSPSPWGSGTASLLGLCHRLQPVCV